MSATTILTIASTLPDFIQYFIYEFASGDCEYRRAKATHEILLQQVMDDLYIRLRHKHAMEHTGLQLDTLLAQLQVSGSIKSIVYPSIIPGQIYMRPRSALVFPDACSSMEFGVTWSNQSSTKSIIMFRLDAIHGSTFTILNYGKPIGGSYRVHNCFTNLAAELSSL